MRIVILGSTGMLGSAVMKNLSEVFGKSNVLGSYRCYNHFPKTCNGFEFTIPSKEYTLHKIPEDTCYVINCIGIIIPLIKKVGIIDTIQINSIFPYMLEKYCEERNIKLIHITTDCVFSGGRGKYTEEDKHDPSDLYGRSKSLGEPDNCMVLRTSIIGEEQYNKISLVEWAKSQRGKSIKGFTNHFWNGVTTKQYSNICIKIIQNNLYEKGIFHVFSPEDVSKKDLLEMISKKFNLELNIESFETEISIDRTLRTIKKLNSKLFIPSIHDQIREM